MTHHEGKLEKPLGWKFAWELNPPPPGDPDHLEWKRLTPAMIDYQQALIDAADAAGRVEPSVYSKGRELVAPDGNQPGADEPPPVDESDPGPAPDPAKGKRKSQGERLNEAVGEADVDLFHDAEFRAYATFEQDGHRETWPIRSGGFRRYVSWLFYQRTDRRRGPPTWPTSWPPSRGRPSSTAA